MRAWQALGAALAGAFALVVAGCIATAVIVYFGWFDVAASSAHLPPVRWLVHRVMMRSVASRSGARAPAYVPVAAAAVGLCLYRTHCQTCHGATAIARDKWANGLNPPPPYLIDARTRWSASELHWIISNGVKMTAMPAWKASMSDKQIWSLVAFLETMPDLPSPAYRRWAAAGTCPTGGEFAGLLRTTPAVAPPISSTPSWPSSPQATPSRS